MFGTSAASLLGTPAGAAAATSPPIWPGEEELGGPASIAAEHLLHRAFFIYDKNACKNEEDPPENKIVFFYPSEGEMEAQLFVIGSCLAMTEFAKNFTAQPTRTLTLDRHKIALLDVEGLTMALTAPLSYPDSALITDLDHIHGAFRFLFGSFEQIRMNTDGELKQFMEFMKRIGRELIPFVRRHERLLFSSFDPLGYTTLPPTANRLFLGASEILASLRSESDNLGGCVLYQDAVLCSHLDPTTTYYVLTRVLNLGDGPASTDAGENKRPNLTETLPVFLRKDDLAVLRDGRRPVIQATQDLRNQMPRGYFEPTSGGEFAGLYVLFMSRLVLAVVMNLPAMYDERHIGKTKSLVHSKLIALESKLTKTLSRPPATQPAVPFNYLAYDAATHRVQASPQEAYTETDARFRIGAKTMHEIFATQRDVNTIMLRDYGGPLLGRRVFGRETFYQHKAAYVWMLSAVRPTVAPRELARLEEVARDNLQDPLL